MQFFHPRGKSYSTQKFKRTYLAKTAQQDHMVLGKHFLYETVKITKILHRLVDSEDQLILLGNRRQ